MKQFYNFEKSDKKGIDDFFKKNEGKFIGTQVLNSEGNISFILDDDFRKTQEQTELEGSRQNLVALMRSNERAMNANEMVRMSLDIMRHPQGITEEQQGEWNKNMKEAKEKNQMTRLQIQNTLMEKKAELAKVDEQIEALFKKETKENVHKASGKTS